MTISRTPEYELKVQAHAKDIESALRQPWGLQRPAMRIMSEERYRAEFLSDPRDWLPDESPDGILVEHKPRG